MALHLTVEVRKQINVTTLPSSSTTEQKMILSPMILSHYLFSLPALLRKALQAGKVAPSSSNPAVPDVCRGLGRGLPHYQQNHWKPLKIQFATQLTTLNLI
jgi:hypothetical protein